MLKSEQHVKRLFPDARPITFEDGVRIMDHDVFIAEDYLFPGTYDLEQAWEYAALACKTTQNFNRTHPMRMDLSTLEAKKRRISKRKKRKQNVG
jgi:hypothetical protein